MWGISRSSSSSSSNGLKEKRVDGKGLIDLVFSWSLSDVLNQHLYKDKVKPIPMTFTSSKHYTSSFIYLLIEETHADLRSQVEAVSRAPACEILSVCVSTKYKAPKGLVYYDVLLLSTTLKDKKEKKYEPQFGDLIALTDVKPRYTGDLNRPKIPYFVGLVQGIDQDDPTGDFMILSKNFSDKPFKFGRTGGDDKKGQLFAIHLTNMITNIRIWMGLNSELEGGSMNIIERVLQTVSIDETTDSTENHQSASVSNAMDIISSHKLDESQKAAIVSCAVTRECGDQHQKSSVKLIWGPPGTGKTKTVASLLFILLRNKCRTLTCAPTNIAVLGITQRLVGLVTDAQPPRLYTYGLGDIVLFGNGERMKIDDHGDLSDVFLENRVEALLGTLYGWRSCIESMICLLQDPEKLHQSYIHSKEKEKEEDCKEVKAFETLKENNNKKANLRQQKAVGGSNNTEDNDTANQLMTFEEFMINRLKIIGNQLKNCFEIFYTHLPTSYISLSEAKKMVRALALRDIIGAILVQTRVSANKCISNIKALNGNVKYCFAKEELCGILKFLCKKLSRLPNLTGYYEIRNFCLKNAQLIFCTASSSAKLHTEWMKPIEVVIIDEAAQLKECESTIPLQLDGLQQAILVGDERQLPAMVQSKMCQEAGFGRSLFERLVILGKKKHMLQVQYRMHPSISVFPNTEFYDKKILDGPNVKETRYKKRFLQGKMYGSYSFINVDHGEETVDNSRSTRNMVEVAIVVEIIASLSKECIASRKKVRVGCISPYKAQVFALQEKLGKKYDTDANSDFSVSVRSIDGFQGGEEDIIIISTARYNRRGSVGFMSNLQRTNVALTRARHCLWVLGNGATLIGSGSVWKKLVVDAKQRGCYYNAVQEKNLAHAVTGALMELKRFETLLQENSPLFSNAVWKVQLSDRFRRSMSRMKSVEVHKKVISIIENLSGGWRLQHHRRDKFPVDKIHGVVASSELLEVYKVIGLLNLVWSIEVVIMEDSERYIQTVKVWDVVLSTEMPKLALSLDKLFGKYSADTMDRCKYSKLVQRNLVVPMTWPAKSSAGTAWRVVENAKSLQLLESKIASLNLKEKLDGL